MGSAAGARKTAATRIGLSVEEYSLFLDAGFKWCGSCRAFHNRDAFGADKSRPDGLAPRCLSSRVVVTDRPGSRERRTKAAEGLSWCRGCKTWLPSALVRQGACRAHLNEEYRAQYAKNPGPTRARTRARRRNVIESALTGGGHRG